MRSIWCGHLKIVMHGASMQNWRDLCVKLSVPGLYLSSLLHSLHWICQSYCGRYFSNYSFRLSSAFTRLEYQTSWIYFASSFSSFDSLSFLHSLFSLVLLVLLIFLSSQGYVQIESICADRSCSNLGQLKICNSLLFVL